MEHRLAVLTQQPKELFEKWLAMVPAGRICDPAELKSVRPIPFVNKYIVSLLIFR